MQRTTSNTLRLLGDVKRARRDHADKSWLAEEATRSDDEARARAEGITYAWIFVIGGLFGLALFDWTQGMAWARALVALIYQVGAV